MQYLYSTHAVPYAVLCADVNMLYCQLLLAHKQIWPEECHQLILKIVLEVKMKVKLPNFNELLGIK